MPLFEHQIMFKDSTKLLMTKYGNSIISTIVIHAIESYLISFVFMMYAEQKMLHFLTN